MSLNSLKGTLTSSTVCWITGLMWTNWMMTECRHLWWVSSTCIQSASLIPHTLCLHTRRSSPPGKSIGSLLETILLVEVEQSVCVCVCLDNNFWTSLTWTLGVLVYLGSVYVPESRSWVKVHNHTRKTLLRLLVYPEMSAFSLLYSLICLNFSCTIAIALCLLRAPKISWWHFSAIVSLCGLDCLKNPVAK